MNQHDRRSFLRSAALAAGAVAVAPYAGTASVFVRQPAKELVFRPYPHSYMPELTWAYATDESEDPFKSSMSVGSQGIVADESIARRFSVNARWYVPGFGYVWLSADNAGKKYTHSEGLRTGLMNLNYEFARSRVARNEEVARRYTKSGTVFSAEVRHLRDLSQELLSDASKSLSNGDKAGKLSNDCLKYALWAGEKIELEKARQDILKAQRKDHVKFGCESRQFIWAKSEDMQKRFVEVMNHATITHYIWDTWYPLFEPSEGVYNWGIKDDILRWLKAGNISVEGRPILWFHPSVTPDWLKNKNFSELKQYVERHTRELVSHYGDDVLEWEVVNEYHDWANIHNHTPEQITEIVKLVCDKTRETNPRVARLINNCCPWAEYAATGRMARMDASRPLRSPRKFMQDINEAGVEYEYLGIQVYFPQRDLSDIVRLLERLEKLGKPLVITEIGASSNFTAPTNTGSRRQVGDEPHAWHRPWDEELQADWLEQVYTIYYSRPSVKAINWYDFADFRTFIVNGGLIREDATPKRSFERLKSLLGSWGRLPNQQG